MNAQEMREQGRALVEEGRCKIQKGHQLIALASTMETLSEDIENFNPDLPITVPSTNGHSNGQSFVRPDYSTSPTNMDKLKTFLRCQTRPMSLSEIKEYCPIPSSTAGAYLYGKRYRQHFKKMADGKFTLAKYA